MMTASYFRPQKKTMPPCDDDYRKMPQELEIRNESCRQNKKSRTCIALNKEDGTIKLLRFFSLLFITMCFLMTMIKCELKVVKHTFEDGIDDWKVENQSWLRLPFSRLKQDHPNLAKPTPSNSTVGNVSFK